MTNVQDKQQRLSDYEREKVNALFEVLDPLLTTPEEIDAHILLWEFIYVFRNLDRYREENNWLKKAYYFAVTVPVLVHGYVLDIKVNQTMGRKLFDDFAKFGTLTATLKRVKKAWGRAQVGVTSMTEDLDNQNDLAVQICDVLSMFDPGHC